MRGRARSHAGESSRGEKAHERTVSGDLTLARGGVVASTDLSGGARLRRALRRVRRAVSAVARNRRHGPSVQQAREGELRQRVGAAGKAVVKPSSASRQAAAEREPARKQRPARAGTAPREGKSSEGRLQERERHGIRPPSVGASRPTACSARGTLRREVQPEPSRGARTLRTAPARDRRSLVHRAASRRSAVKRGTRRRVFEGARNPGEADPALAKRSGRRPLRRATERGGEGERAASTRTNSEGEPNSTRGSLGTKRPGSLHDGKNPRPVETARGERQEPRKRYPLAQELWRRR